MSGWPAYCPTETTSLSSATLAASDSRITHSLTMSRSAPTQTTPMSVSLLRCTPDDTSTLIAVSLSAPSVTPNVLNRTTAFAVLTSPAAGNEEVSFAPSPSRNGSNVPIVSITTSPVARSVLVLGPAFAFNLTFDSPANAVRWSVRTVTLATSSSSRSTSNVPLNWSGSTNQGKTVPCWSELVAHPPNSMNGMWLPVDAAPLVAQTLSLRIAFACGVDDVLVVQLQIPAPGYPQQLASQVEAATRYSQVASALAGGASSGSALGRVMAIRSMVVCEADTAVGGGVLDFGLQLCPSSAETDIARSAVVSNAVVLACVFVFLLLLSCLWAHARGVSLRSALLVFSMPSSAYPACVAILPSTSAAVALLAARMNSSSCVGLDAVLIALGLCVVIGCECALTAVCTTCHCGDNTIHNVPQWECRQRPRHLPANDVHSFSLFARFIQPYAAVVLHRAWKWHAKMRSSRVALKRTWVVLLEYRVLWFAALDSGMLVVVVRSLVDWRELTRAFVAR